MGHKTALFCLFSLTGNLGLGHEVALLSVGPQPATDPPTLIIIFLSYFKSTKVFCKLVGTKKIINKNGKFKIKIT